jgi:hypothetical protein
MFMTVDSGVWSSDVTCQVTLRGGRVVTIGVFKLANGSGAWETRLPVAGDEVQSARLVAGDGTLLASARLN